MTTKTEMIAIIKAENPTLQIGDDEQGYTQLNAAEYEARVSEWVDSRLAELEQAAAIQQAEADRAALLARLGITAEEAALLLGGTN